MDEDDRWLPGKLRDQLLSMKLSQSLMCCTCGVEANSNVSLSLSDTEGGGGAAAVEEKDVIKPNLPQHSLRYGNSLRIKDLEEGVNPIISSSVILHSCLIKTAGGFGRSKYNQDLIYWRKCFLVNNCTIDQIHALHKDNEIIKEFHYSESNVPSWINSSNWYGHCHFIQKAHVICGIKKSEISSSTNQETRETIESILKETRTSNEEGETPHKSVSSLIEGFVGV